MSKKANPTAIGVFLIVGLALGIGAIVLFSSIDLFGKSDQYILYFDSSVKGLSAGAPVKFRGVTVGSVQDVLIRHNQRASDTDSPVIIKVEESLIRKKTDRTIEMADDNTFQAMVDRGLRGMLEAQSFVTGVLYVELDVLPNSPSPHLHQIVKEYKEIPTVPTHFQAIVEKLSDVDVKKAMALTTSVLVKFEQRLDELNMADISQGLTDLLTILNQILRMPSLTNSLASLQQTADEYRHLSETVRVRVDPLAENADKTLQEAQKTMVEMRQDLQTLRDVLSPQAPFRHDLGLTLNELAEAARSVNGLADYLTRHPDALLRGRSHEEPKP